MGKNILVSQLRNSITERSGTAEELLGRIVEIGCKIFRLDIGILSRITDDDYMVEYVHSTDGTLNFSSPAAKADEVSSDDLELITEMAGWVSQLLQRA